LTSLKQIVKGILGNINCRIQAGKKTTNCYITYAGSGDGAGSQIHSIFSILLFAKKFNLIYVHTPIKNIEHYRGDRDEWSRRWEDFFSLGKDEIPVKSIDSSQVKSVFVKYPLLLNKKSNTLFLVSNCHSYTDTCPSDFSLIIDDLRKKYNLKNHSPKTAKTRELQLCVHIRRGDVNSTNRNSFRYSSNISIKKNLVKILEFYNRQDIRFKLSIYSEGEEKDFVEFKELNPIFCLNENEFITFDKLVNADILVTAKSSFSYVAGLLNKGIVFYEPFWHKPLPSWIHITASKEQIASILTKEMNKDNFRQHKFHSLL
jgi:hypothetical protein